MASMELRILRFDGDSPARPIESPPSNLETGWVWIDIDATAEDLDELATLAEGLGLDALAVRDAIEDLDLPKADDFGSSLLVILHALAENEVATYELDCFLTDRHLITIRQTRSPAVEALWDGVQRRIELGAGGPDDLLARLADITTRRLLTLLDVFDHRAEELVELALTADPGFLGEITAVRADLSTLRRAIHPQREMLDVLRRTTSPLVTESGRRRFSDVFDVATRASAGVDEARAALAETLDAYGGAEARQATEVTKVLTVYAAIMLPLSLIAGFFGMNFTNIPLVGSDAGWVVVSGFMAVVAVVSLGVFITLGWTRRPSGRAAGAVLGHGLIEAARTPAHLVGAVYEISTMPLRSVTATRRPRRPAADPPTLER